MTVTVIIPAFNAESTISAAIHSCLAQTMQDLEVIVVDDASADSTAQIVTDVAATDPRVRLLALSINGGVARARNAGLTAARGDWIALLDADDTYAAARLEKMLARAQSLGADLLADNLQVAFTNNTQPSRLAFPDMRMRDSHAVTAGALAASDRPRWGLPAAGFMKPIMRRSFLEQHRIRYIEDIRAVEDFHLYMHCLFSGAKLFYMPEAYYCYTVDERSLSRGDSKRVRERLINSSRRLCQEAELVGDQDALKELRKRDKDITFWLSFKPCELAVKEKRYGDAFKAFLHLPSKRYALLRFAGKFRYALALRLGVTLDVKEARQPNTFLNIVKHKLFRI